MDIPLRLGTEAQVALDQLVADEGLPANDIVNLAVLQYAARRTRTREVLAAFRAGEIEWADVLQRLQRHDEKPKARPPE